MPSLPQVPHRDPTAAPTAQEIASLRSFLQAQGYHPDHIGQIVASPTWGEMVSVVVEIQKQFSKA